MDSGTPLSEPPAARWASAMRRSDFAAAWAIGDAVLAAGGTTPDDPRLPYHLRHVWDGRPPDGRHVLVRCYHGLGDVLMMARLLPMLRARVRSLAVEAPGPLLPLLSAVPGPDLLIGFDLRRPAPPADCDIELMEVAHALRLRPGELPLPPYLAAPAPLRLAPAPAVGLCWQSGDWDEGRSVPLCDLLDAIGGKGLVSLQRGPAAAEAQALHFANPGDACMGVIRTAALIAGLDLVVTVDTMVAHLAGALGIPCCVLLKAEADWRWGSPGGRSPWYPKLRLYRQERAGEWSAPLAVLACDLASLTGRAAD